MHWELAGHGASDGCLVELVRIQSWARYDHENNDPSRTYWAFDEGRKRSGCKQIGGFELGQTFKNKEMDDWEEISEGAGRV